MGLDIIVSIDDTSHQGRSSEVKEGVDKYCPDCKYYSIVYSKKGNRDHLMRRDNIHFALEKILNENPQKDVGVITNLYGIATVISNKNPFLKKIGIYSCKVGDPMFDAYLTGIEQSDSRVVLHEYEESSLYYEQEILELLRKLYVN